MTWRDKQVSIMTDSLSGAVAIARAAGTMLLEFAEEEAGNTPQDMIGLLCQLAREILTAQSGMSSLVTLFNRVFFAIGPETESDAIALMLQETVRTFLQNMQFSREEISRNAAALINSNLVVLTHSASSTVLRTITNARKTGRTPRVLCMEGRPLLEGRQQAAALAEQGIDVTLIIDSAAYHNLKAVDLVLVGADSLTEDGAVAKIGTASVAVSAQTLGIPCYFLADTAKVWPAILGSQPVHGHAPADVWEEAPEGIRVQNHYYDLTPWTAISGVITEHGLTTANEIRSQSRSHIVHNFLQSVIADVRSTVA